jgi:hypothetical protein
VFRTDNGVNGLAGKDDARTGWGAWNRITPVSDGLAEGWFWSVRNENYGLDRDRRNDLTARHL